MNLWIDISLPGSQAPEFGEVILLADAVSQVICLGILNEAEGDVCFFTVMYVEELPPDFNVTHWSKLPELPK